MNQRVIKLAQSLVRIPSTNPTGNEKKIAFFIRDYLKKNGLPSRLIAFKKDRFNVVAEIPSRTSRKKILLTPHIDTVPVTGTWKYPPFSGTLVKEKIYCRGATDCKSNVAIVLFVITELARQKITLEHLDIIAAFTADEETGSGHGIRPLVKALPKIDYGIVLDSDELNIIVAQKGLLHLRVEITGKEAHGAYPERGVNAVEKAVLALNDILKTPFSYTKHPLLIKPTLTIGRIGGGEKVNIVAGHCFFELDIRWLPSMKQDKIIAGIKKIISRYTEHYRIKILAAQDPIEVNRDTPAMKMLITTLKKHHIKPRLVPSFGATVINFLNDRGIPSFAFGCGSRGTAHTRNEYVKVKNLLTGASVLFDYLIALDKQIGKTLP